jgi:cytochrome d ubiquinol oxidase subunit II
MLADVLAAAILLSLNAWLLSGGADFGGGVWDLLAGGPRRDRQRALIADAIAPIWEANHVWLVLAVVLTFSCFPPVFAALSIQLHIPLTLVLLGIVMRGSAFVFRSYDSRSDDVQQRWGRVFSVSSLITPVLLGVAVGALASGTIGRRNWPPVTPFADRYVWPWITPFTIVVGLMALALVALLAAVYLTVEAEREPELAGDFRRRAFGAQAAVVATAIGGLGLAPAHAPSVAVLLWESPVARVMHVVVGLAVVAASAALWVRRYRVARMAVAAQGTVILWGWGLAQYPHLAPPDYQIANSAAPTATLRLVLGALVVGLVLIIPAFLYLFGIFKGAVLGGSRGGEAAEDERGGK